jgi:hypothetical protein
LAKLTAVLRVFNIFDIFCAHCGLKGMTCSNCGSSRLRRSKRSLGEKVFLPILLVRPFRCEDCISRFYGWLWQSPGNTSPEADARSLVYQSSTAALHSAGHGLRRVRRRVIAKGLQPFRKLTGTSITSWLSKPVGQQRFTNVALAADDIKAFASQAGYFNISSKPQSAPEILGVIPERKIEEI